ncbi:MAG: RNA polymerase sigma factor [Phycisphaerales bacterium]|nr:MAG: RNA polymerase sigma factor [Phycisphaerales bacterium]
MISPNTTTSQLLEALHDRQNQDAWRECDARYRPIIVAFARKLGLDEADAADVAQETMTQFLSAYQAGQYDRTRGRLRSWIIAIAKFRIADLKRSQARRRQVRGESAFEEAPPDDAALGAIWEEEVRQAVVRRSLEELRERSRMDPKTVRAFEMVALEQRSAAEVAAELGMTVNDVYVAKNRAIERLRKIRDVLGAAYEIE